MCYHSKIAFVHLVQRLAAGGCQLIDCQMSTAHLHSLGAEEISRQITSIAQVSEQNADIAENSCALGGDLENTAHALNALVTRFNG